MGLIETECTFYPSLFVLKACKWSHIDFGKTPLNMKEEGLDISFSVLAWTILLFRIFLNSINSNDGKTAEMHQVIADNLEVLTLNFWIEVCYKLVLELLYLSFIWCFIWVVLTETITALLGHHTFSANGSTTDRKHKISTLVLIEPQWGAMK